MFRAKVEGQGTMPVEITLRYLLQLLYALEYAHGEKVVHGNLKPENVLFDRMGNVKLTDFGMGRITEKSADQPAPVYVGMGTPSYMAPEQLHGTAAVGPAADVYALGILLYEMLTGTLPGRRSPMPSKANKDVPEQLDDLFDKMTHDRIEDRYQSMSQVLDHLYRSYSPDEILDRGSLLLFHVDPLPPAGAEEAPAAAEDDAGAGGEPQKADPAITAEIRVSKEDLDAMADED
jgi:serine/threonine protein kinase